MPNHDGPRSGEGNSRSRMHSSGSRRRGQVRNRTGSAGPRRNGGLNLRNVCESNGPNGRLRGNPAQLVEKYLALAHEATNDSDHVLMQALLQHAEHYTRLINEHNQRNEDSKASSGDAMQSALMPPDDSSSETASPGRDRSSGTPRMSNQSAHDRQPTRQRRSIHSVEAAVAADGDRDLAIAPNEKPAHERIDPTSLPQPINYRSNAAKT